MSFSEKRPWAFDSLCESNPPLLVASFGTLPVVPVSGKRRRPKAASSVSGPLVAFRALIVCFAFGSERTVFVRFAVRSGTGSGG